MGTVHFHLGATQGGDERRVHERHGDCEHGLLTPRKVVRFQFSTGSTTVLAPLSTRVACIHRCAECMYRGVSSSDGARVLPGNVVIGMPNADVLAVVKGMHCVH